MALLASFLSAPLGQAAAGLSLARSLARVRVRLLLRGYHFQSALGHPLRLPLAVLVHLQVHVAREGSVVPSHALVLLILVFRRLLRAMRQLQLVLVEKPV